MMTAMNKPELWLVLPRLGLGMIDTALIMAITFFEKKKILVSSASLSKTPDFFRPLIGFWSAWESKIGFGWHSHF
jgi:hypothetical protein